jgi:hypothetical protein
LLLAGSRQQGALKRDTSSLDIAPIHFKNVGLLEHAAGNIRSVTYVATIAYTPSFSQGSLTVVLVGTRDKKWGGLGGSRVEGDETSNPELLCRDWWWWRLGALERLATV